MINIPKYQMTILYLKTLVRAMWKRTLSLIFRMQQQQMNCLTYCVEKQVPVVLCTTDFSEEQLEKVEESAKKVAVLKSANMSLGINLLLKILQDATKKYFLRQDMISNW